MSQLLPSGSGEPRTWSEWTTSAEVGADATRVAGRYLLVGLLGEGAHGQVYRAMDELDGAVVAVKRFHRASPDVRARVHREIAALRLLDLPGVVRIIDDGAQDGAPFVVMELVEGRRFPGVRRGEGQVRRQWEALAEATTALLETLGRVHEAGVIHRDIKPGNVLVREDGRPVLLDFGLARGAPVGSTITREGAVLGTPRYLAPEQLLGERADARTDLYAVGVMVYEALAGRPPHQAEDLDSLWRAKLTSPAVPLRHLAPDVPGRIAAVIDALLARRPDARPATAADVVSALGGGAIAGLRPLPWLGSRAVVDALVASAHTGTPLDVVGARGSGRTRCLREAAAALEADAFDVAWTVPGRAPFESLEPVLGAAPTSGNVPALLRERLAVRLGDDTVLLVDDLDRVDRWTRELVASLDGPILRAVALPGARDHVTLEALREVELRPLFHGPDRILHLREDGARALHRRTAGRPAEIAAELRAWVRAGLARWDDGLVRVERAALDRLRTGLRVRPGMDAGAALPDELDPQLRHLLTWLQLAGDHARIELLAEVVARPRWEVELELEALERLGVARPPGEVSGAWEVGLAHDLAATWPGDLRREAHRRIAAALRTGEDGRLFHMLAGGALDGLAEEAVSAARRLRAAGRVGEAEGTLREALRLLHREERPMPGVLAELVRTAMASETVAALERARFEVERCGGEADLLALLDAALAARAGRAGPAREALESLGPFAEPALEYSRQVARLQAVHHGFAEGGDALLEELRDWATATGDTEVQAKLPGWEGLVRFRQGRFDEAAALHEESAARRSEDIGRLSALLNAADAWLEAGELDKAEAVARQALDAAARLRAPHYEARAELTLRGVVATRRLPVGADLGLVEAVEALGQPHMFVEACVIEARLAWLGGDDEGALSLALRGRKAAGELGEQHVLHRYLRAVVIFLAPEQSDESPAEIEALLAWAGRCAIPGVGLDVMGMLARAGFVRTDRSALARSRYSAIPRGSRDFARGMLALDDALEAVLVSSGRSP